MNSYGSIAVLAWARVFAGAVVATDTVSADAGRDNGTPPCGLRATLRRAGSASYTLGA
jgi:hypothetical protein